MCRCSRVLWAVRKAQRCHCAAMYTILAAKVPGCLAAWQGTWQLVVYIGQLRLALCWPRLASKVCLSLSDVRACGPWEIMSLHICVQPEYICVQQAACHAVVPTEMSLAVSCNAFLCILSARKCKETHSWWVRHLHVTGQLSRLAQLAAVLATQ